VYGGTWIGAACWWYLPFGVNQLDVPVHITSGSPKCGGRYPHKSISYYREYTAEVRDISQTWHTYDYKIGINKYPGNAGEINQCEITEPFEYVEISGNEIQRLENLCLWRLKKGGKMYSSRIHKTPFYS
jgi:hypothetical protein